MELPVPGERSLLAPAFRLIDRDLPASAEPHYQGLALHFQHSLAATATQRQPTPLPLGIPNFQGSFGVPSPTSCSNLGRRKAMRTCYPQPSVRGITPIIRGITPILRCLFRAIAPIFRVFLSVPQHWTSSLSSARPLLQSTEFMERPRRGPCSRSHVARRFSTNHFPHISTDLDFIQIWCALGA